MTQKGLRSQDTHAGLNQCQYIHNSVIKHGCIVFPQLALNESSIFEWKNEKVPPESIVTGSDVTKPAWACTHDFPLCDHTTNAFWCDSAT